MQEICFRRLVGILIKRISKSKSLKFLRNTLKRKVVVDSEKFANKWKYLLFT